MEVEDQTPLNILKWQRVQFRALADIFPDLSEVIDPYIAQIDAQLRAPQMVEQMVFNALNDQENIDDARIHELCDSIMDVDENDFTTPEKRLEWQEQKFSGLRMLLPAHAELITLNRIINHDHYRADQSYARAGAGVAGAGATATSPAAVLQQLNNTPASVRAPVVAAYSPATSLPTTPALSSVRRSATASADVSQHNSDEDREDLLVVADYQTPQPTSSTSSSLARAPRRVVGAGPDSANNSGGRDSASATPSANVTPNSSFAAISPQVINASGQDSQSNHRRSRRLSYGVGGK